MKVFAIRFTAEVPAQRRFLEALGLAPRISSDGGGRVIDESFGRSLHGRHPAQHA